VAKTPKKRENSLYETLSFFYDQTGRSRPEAALVLSYEPPFEPPVRFLKAGFASGFSEAHLWKMVAGETRALV